MIEANVNEYFNKPNEYLKLISWIADVCSVLSFYVFLPLKLNTEHSSAIQLINLFKYSLGLFNYSFTFASIIAMKLKMVKYSMIRYNNAIYDLI